MKKYDDKAKTDKARYDQEVKDYKANSSSAEDEDWTSSNQIVLTHLIQELWKLSCI